LSIQRHGKVNVLNGFAAKVKILYFNGVLAEKWALHYLVAYWICKCVRKWRAGKLIGKMKFINVFDKSHYLKFKTLKFQYCN